MFVYLSKKYMLQEKLVAIEIVIIKSLDDIKYEIVLEKDFPTLCGRYHDSKFDFAIDGYNVICNHPVRILKVPNVSFLPVAGVEEVVKVASLYDLVKDLANESCAYCQNPDEIEDNYIGYVRSFSNIRVSQSTMTISISLLDTDKNAWYSKNIIGINSDGMLEQNSFCCLIPKCRVTKFRKYNLTFIKDCKVNNEDYSLFQYNCDLSICNTTSALVFNEPVICHFSYLEFLYKNVINCAKAYVRSTLEPTHEVPKQQLEQKARPATNRSGVFISLKSRAGTIKEFTDNVLLYAQSLVFGLTQGEIQKLSHTRPESYTYEEKVKVYAFGMKKSAVGSYDSDEIVKFVRDLSLPIDYYYYIEIIASILASGKTAKLDSVDTCNKVIEEYNLLYLNISLFLYNIRVSCVYNPEILTVYKNLYKFVITGSIYMPEVTIKIIK